MPHATAPRVDRLTASLTDAVVEKLRERLVDGEIPAGSHMLVRDLTRQFGVSHVPVREALRKLEGEGLVTYTAQRGAVAASVSEAELIEVYDLRRMLECSIVRKAVPMYDGDTLSRLATALKEMDLARMHAPNSAETRLAHRKFHLAMLTPGCTELTTRILHQLWHVSERYIVLAVESNKVAKGPVHHHILYDACCSRDAEFVARTLDEHLRLTEAALITRFHQWMLRA